MIAVLEAMEKVLTVMLMWEDAVLMHLLLQYVQVMMTAVLDLVALILME
jgi:hypothetical protein